MVQTRLLNAGREALWILLLALALAAGAHFMMPDRLQQGMQATGSGDGTRDNLLTIEAAAEHHRQGTAVFADARPDGAFRMGHIQGALNLDPDLFDTWAETVFSQIPAESMIITYCDGERCTLSLDLVEKLTWLGYEKVYHIKNGWHLWQEAGLPIGVGPQ